MAAGRFGDRRRRRGHYGVDAPRQLALACAIPIVSAAVAIFGWTRRSRAWSVVAPVAGLSAALSAASTAIFLHTTLRGKFVVWDEVLAGLALRGDERVLDLGCGRGGLLLSAAARLPAGMAVGVDRWTTDQYGNAADITRRNAELEGVGDRVEICTADIRKLPFRDGSFDLVLSSVVIHNVRDAEGRAMALEEAVRVLRSGGRLAIIDMDHPESYAVTLRGLGVDDVGVRSLGWRLWYGGPSMTRAKMVSGKKPA